MSYDLTKLARLNDVRALGIRAKEILNSNGNKIFNVSLETTSWLTPTGGEPEPVSNYAYRCFIPATSLGVTLTENDRVDVIFDYDTLALISSDGSDICSYSVTTTDGVYLFNNTMPTETYNAQLWLISKAEVGTGSSAQSDTQDSSQSDASSDTQTDTQAE